MVTPEDIRNVESSDGLVMVLTRVPMDPLTAFGIGLAVALTLMVCRSWWRSRRAERG
jgi:nucleoside 2-deoxyribosyltransferase